MILGKYNQSKTVYFDLFQVDGIDFESAASFATGDVKIMKDEGAEANTSNLPTDEGQGYSLVLTATEMSAARIKIYVVDQTGTKVWLDTGVHIETYGNASAEHAFDLDTASTAQTADHTAAIADIPTNSEFNARTLATADYFDPATDAVATVTTLTNKTGFSLAATGLDAIASTAVGMVEIAKAIWDRLLTGGTHNINNSAGKKLRGIAGIVFVDGTAQSGNANSIQLASGDVTTNDLFRRAKVVLTAGAGVGQEAIITASVASTDTCTTTPAWLISPDATTEYIVIPAQAHTTVRNGGYDAGMVYIDTVNGTAGTEKGVNGTSTNPSLTIVDAYTIANNENITEFSIVPGSALTLPSDSTGFRYRGGGYTIALNGQEIGDCTFNNAASISGIGVNTSGGQAPAFFLCGLGTLTLPPCNGFQCGFFGVLTVGSEGSFTFGGSSEVFNSSLTVDYGSSRNASQFFLTSWGGGSVEIQNAGAGTGSYVFEMNGTGNLLVNANCSATTLVTLRGHINRNADVSGITYDEAANLIAIIGPAGLGLTDLGGMSTGMQAEVNAEVDTAISDAALATASALAVIDGIVDNILLDTAEIGTAGAGLTDLGGMSTGMTAEVLAQANAALDTAISELSVAAPAATPTTRTALMLMYMALRNKLVVQTSGTDALEIYNNAGTKIASKLITDDGSDYTEAEMT